ncbi:MAG: DUF2147 domain-containing protein [Bacteroidota bacterium]
MKPKFNLIYFSLFFLLTAFSLSQESISGKWFSPDLSNSTIEIYKAEDGFQYGKIVESDEKDWIGETVLKKLAYDQKAKSWKGEVYSLVRKMTIDVEVTTTNESKLKLVGSRFFFTKTFYWSKK